MSNPILPALRATLGIWHRVLSEGVRGAGPDLSARQMAVLLSVYLAERSVTVRGLAAELGVSKPAITRALDALARHGYIRRARDRADGRNVLVQRTVKGAVFLSDLAEAIDAARAQAD